VLEPVAPPLLPPTPLLEVDCAEPSSPVAPDEVPLPPSSPAVASSPVLQELQPPLLLLSDPLEEAVLPDPEVLPPP
jgi:hypothetical protein